MSSQMNYLIFCMKQYKLHKHLSVKEVAELFKQYRVYEYILSCFDALHTTGTRILLAEKAEGSPSAFLLIYEDVF